MPTPPIRQRATGRVTLADVALAAGVSPITVSRALRGERAVAPELVERVQAAAAKLGYVPDPAARALASHRSTHVAVLIPMLSNELFVTLLEAVQTSMRRAGYQTLIGVTHYDPGEEEQLLREQLMHRPAGLLVTGFDHTEATQALMARSGVPCVHLMENSPDEGVYSVGFSQSDAGADLTRHLIARGKRRIAFAAVQMDPRTLQRQAGWRAVMQAEGLFDPTLEWMNPAPSSMALGGLMFGQIMGQTPPIDAIFFCNDDLAQGALLAANRMQVAVPQRVAIVGFNDLRGSDLMLPPLTTVHTPLDRIGEEGAAMLLKLMRHEAVPERCIDVGYTVVVRQST
ncbi:MAG: LacI family DNA-binding transcriptional regulator [Comamonadaceae bacterium]|jgi:LacI family gluconate utilization system Gnt-I transcriptional repressor|uniref:LacI family DNA-binding transcriptional regulator n=2 Tax=Candidatus Skiveiella danica TaxID=3386177 RepID=UPI001B64F63D|nr:LacI family DNA-binding transcriptional regulator [Comamonadaceae bacterium]MBK9199958.1 LacI family DNA-binding transcriptional regulator [Betaproteobacteria bacterium]MBP6308004.1 LacI family DNA-binding transcriptional regulator [Burkholderiaceae bacterium]MBK7510379.1 LacI family DNA-binding transcriptional regulator [Comamonadaceae bacterium]MBK7989531.1 LacI family DNA-binding transcriptional regulator [Comamonadaceae bacterium]